MAAQTFSIKLTANGKEVKELMDALKKQANDYEQQLGDINEKLKERDKLTKEEIKALEQQSNSLAAKIKALGTAVEENITNLRKVDEVMNNLSGSSGAELGKALRGIGQQMKRVSDLTLKSGETMEQKLTELKEKLIEVRHEMTKREGIDAMKRAQATMQELANTPLDKLRMGLDSIEKKLATMSEAERRAAGGMQLLDARNRYKAQIAVTESGPADNGRDIAKMNADQLRAEQARLRTAYQATDGAKGYEAVSQEYLTRLQAVNQQLQQMNNVDLNKVFANLDGQKLSTLEQALKQVKEQAAQIKVGDETQIKQTAQQIEVLEAKIAEAKQKLGEGIADALDFDNLQDVPTEKLEQALKQLEQQEKRLIGTDTAGAQKMAENKRKVQEQINRNRRAVQDYANAEKVAANTGKHNVTELKQAYETLQQKLMGLNTGQKREIEATRQQMKKLKSAIDETTGAISKQSGIWSTAVKNITAYVGVFGMFNAIKNGIMQVIRGSAELSDQMAKVRMVSGLAMEDIEQLTRRLAKLDTRTTLQELNEIAYAGAKLGFGEMGIDAMEQFTVAANQVNVALKEDLGQEALTALSKITENMGLIKKMGVEQAMLSTSSAMFKLFTSSTAAAGPIVEVTKRLAPMAQISGFATHEILALASASDALMQSSEVAGTALSKFMMAMQNNHNIIEKNLGITQGTIAQMMKSGKSMEAFMLILDKMSGKNVTELSGIWKLLGSEGDRLIRVMLSMANHTDLVRTHLNTSEKAFKEATAVTEEYNIQQETAMAYLQRAENKWRNAFINPDSAESVKQLTKAWYDFTKSITDSDFALGAIKRSVDFLLIALRALIALLPGITFGLMIKGAASLVAHLRMSKVATDGFTTSWKKMDAATKASWIGMIAGVIANIVFWMKEWASSTSDAEKEHKKLDKAIESMHEKQDQEIGNLKRLKKQLDDTNISQDERNALLAKVRTDYDIYLNYLGIEKNAVTDLTKHYDALVKVMKQRFAYQEREDYKRDVMGGEDGLRMNRRKAGSDLSRQGKSLGVKADLDMIINYVKNGKSASDIYGLMFADIKAAENAALQARPSGGATYATPGAAATASNDYNHSYSNFRMALEGYVKRIQQEVNKEAEIDAAFASEIGDFDYDKWLRTQVTGDFKLVPDKEAAAAARKAQQEAKQALRKELDDAKKESDAIISKIEEWYRLQETVITGYAADGTWTQEKADQMIAQLNMAKNQMLADARRGISGRDEASWEKHKQQIGQLMFDTGDYSKKLLDEILNVRLENVRTALGHIDQQGKQYNLSSTALRDQMNKNAAGNEREIQRILRRAQQEVEKMLLQYNFLEQALQAFDTRLEKLGLLSESARAAAQRIQQTAGTDEEREEQEQQINQQRTKAKQSAALDFIAGGASSLSVNYENVDDLKAWLEQFISSYMEDPNYHEGIDRLHFKSWAETFREDFEQWVTDSNKYKQDIQAFYLSLVNAEENYYKKRRESFNFEKQQLDQRNRVSGNTDQEEQTNSALEARSKMQDAGIGATFAQQIGLGSIENDPEVLMIQNRIHYRQLDVESAQKRLDQIVAMQDAEIAKMQEAGATKEEIEARQREMAQQRMGAEDLLKDRQTALFDQETALATKVAQELQKRVQTINNLTKPIQDGAKNIGQKFGEMIRGVEEDSMTWNEIWRSMAVAVGESVIDMTAQYAQNLIMEKAMNAQSKQEAIDKATVDVAAGTASGAAKTIGTLGWWGIALIPVIAALLKGLLNAAFASNKSSDTSNTTTSASKMKLVSNMLTYDEGNVYAGTDGHVYSASAVGGLPAGVSLVKSPIATTVNGQPSLVAERGPEIIIGRRATRHIQMNEPGLLHHLAAINGRYRTYDQGTVPAAVPLASPSGTPATTPDGSPSGDNARVAAALEQNTAMMLAMQQTIAALSQTVTTLQQRGIPAHIQKYGTGGLIDEVKSGLKFDQRYNR